MTAKEIREKKQTLNYYKRSKRLKMNFLIFVSNKLQVS